MKLLILSDIHSNVCALSAVLDAEKDADGIYCAGDLTDYGPFPHETLSLCRACGMKSVLGNHDRALIDRYRRGDFGSPDKRERTWSQHNCERLSEEEIDFLSSLPERLDFTADGISYRLQHQFGNGYDRPTFVDAFDGLAEETTRRLIFGHTHRQAIVSLRGGRVWCNPGSVSYRRPDDSDKAAHYAVIENGVISLRAVSYDRTPLLRETLALAESGTLAEGELKVGFFFFGSAPDIFTSVEDSIKREKAQ